MVHSLHAQMRTQADESAVGAIFLNRSADQRPAGYDCVVRSAAKNVIGGGRDLLERVRWPTPCGLRLRRQASGSECNRPLQFARAVSGLAVFAEISMNKPARRETLDIIDRTFL